VQVSDEPAGTPGRVELLQELLAQVCVLDQPNARRWPLLDRSVLAASLRADVRTLVEPVHDSALGDVDAIFHLAAVGVMGGTLLFVDLSSPSVRPAGVDRPGRSVSELLHEVDRVAVRVGDTATPTRPGGASAPVSRCDRLRRGGLSSGRCAGGRSECDRRRPERTRRTRARRLCRR